MRIEELHLKNFRCFKELDIKLPESNLAVFIGINGSGKTAILDAISICLSNFPEIVNPRLSTLDENKKSKDITRDYINKNKIGDIINNEDDVFITSLESVNRITISYDSKNASWETNFKDDKSCHIKIIKHDKFSDKENTEVFILFVCIYYNASKNEVHSIDWTGSHISTFLNFETWFEKEENIENELKYRKKDFSVTNPNLDAVRKAMSVFLSNMSNANFHSLRMKRIFDDTGTTGTYEEEIKKHRSFLVVTNGDTELKVSQLSSGQRLLLKIVGDITYRLIVNNRSFKKDEKFSDSILNSSAIVLIDEIELHLHPQWQREVLPALQKTFPNIQFIVTTHSPQVLSHVKKEEIFILEDGAIIKNTPHTQGRDSNSILFELFGVEERPKEYRHKINAFYDALEDEKFDEAKTILAELTELFGEQDSEIVRANLHLNFATE